MSRRTGSLLIACLMLFSALFSTGLTYAADEQLIFDLDLSASTTENITATNKVAGNSSAVAINGKPGLGEINGNPFLSFSGNAAVKVQDEAFANQDAMTFEAWIKGDNFGAADKGSYRMAVMTTGGEEDCYRFDIYGYDNSIFYRPGGPKATTSTNAPDIRYNSKFKDYDETWSHFVFTRKWTPTGTAEGQGIWSGDIYVNGVKIAANYTNNNNTQQRRDETGLYLVIGNKAYFNSAFKGELAAFKVYNSILSDDAVSAKYEADKMNYIAYADTLELTELSAQNGILDDTAGELTLTFNNYLDAATVAEGITLTKADGSEIRGGAYAEAKSAFSNQAVIRYGALETGADYLLQIHPSLSSVNGKSYLGDNAFSYTAERSYLYYEDFSGDEYVVGESPVSDGILQYESIGVSGDASTIKVCDGGGYKYISMTGGGVIEKNSRIKLAFNPVLEDDIFVADVKLRPASTDGASNVAPRNVMTVSGSTSSVQLADMREGYMQANKNLKSGATGTDIKFETTDDNGFYDMQVVFAKNNTGNYVMTLSNQNKASEGQMVYTSGDIQSVKQIEISHLYPLDKTQATYVSADVARIALYKLTAPNVLYTNIESLNREDDALEIVFNDDMDADMLNDDSFSLTAPDGTHVNLRYGGYDEAARKVTLRLMDYLASSTEYTLHMNGITSASGLAMRSTTQKLMTKAAEVRATAYSLTDATDRTLTTLDGVTVCRANITVDGAADRVCTAALMLYDAEGRVLRLVTDTDDGTVLSGKPKSVSVSADITDEITKVMLLSWIEKDNGAISLIKPIVLTKTAQGGLQ